jgi:DNA polymerase I-like protein with 3'-5' exonuclease and polymerase domains
MIDFTGFEMKIAAARQGDKVPLSTGDIHTENARKLFGVTEVTPKLRRKAKEAMFLYYYGGNPRKVGVR